MKTVAAQEIPPPLGPLQSSRNRLSLVLVCAALHASAVAQVQEAPQESWAYQVQPGDTLIGIAAAQMARPADWRRLQRLNRVAQPRRLQPGRVLQIPLSWMAQAATVAEVAFVHGPVERLQPGAPVATDSRWLRMGATLAAKDVIRTGAGATLTLRLPDGSRLLVAPDSEVEVVHLLSLGRPALPAVRLNLNQGSTEIHVAPAATGRSFEMQTPALNLGVRGTDFRAQVDAGGLATRLEVLQGRVTALSSAGTVPVDAGLGTLARIGQAMTPLLPLAAAPLLSAVPRRLERVPLHFSWPVVTGAQGYRAQVLLATSADHLLLDGRFTEPRAKWADLPDGHYTLRVRTVDPQGLEGHDAVASFELKARPEPPLVSMPSASGTVVGELAAFSWARVPAAVRYRLQVSATSDFAQPVFDSATLTQTQHDLSLAPGVYHWRVASIAQASDGSDDPGPFGDGQDFSLRAVPASPALEPAQAGPKGLELRWKAPQAGQRVRFQVATDSAFDQIVQDQTTTESSVLITDPSPGLYYVRARTIDADGFEGPFGMPQQVEVSRSGLWWLLAPLGLLLLSL